MDRFLKATGIGSKRNVTSPNTNTSSIKSPTIKSPSTKQLKQVQIDSDSDDSDSESKTTNSEINKLKKNNNNINNNNNNTITSPNIKSQLSNKSILTNSDTKSVKSNTNTNTNSELDSQSKQFNTPNRTNNNNNNNNNGQAQNPRNESSQLKQSSSEKPIILEPVIIPQPQSNSQSNSQTQTQNKIQNQNQTIHPPSTTKTNNPINNTVNNSIITPAAPAPTIPVIIAPPPPQSNNNHVDTHKFEEKITQLEREVEQLKLQKRNLEKSVEQEKLTNHNFQRVIDENKLTIKQLESRVAELTQEEEEMRTELYSKYDEIHNLEESKNRLNAQYLETAKQLRNLETEAVNRKISNVTPIIPVVSQPLPPPPPPQPLQSQISSKTLSSVQSDEIRELRHQMKELEEKLKFQKSLTESKQLMNMKLDGRNRELMQQNDQYKSLVANYRQEIHEKEKKIVELDDLIADLNEKFNGPKNIDKKKILELENEIQRLSEKLIENEKIYEVKEEKSRIQLVDARAEVEFMRKLLTECESQIEVLEGMLEDESSEMTRILSYMKTKNEGLFRFLQSIIRHYQSKEKSINDIEGNNTNNNYNNSNNATTTTTTTTTTGDELDEKTLDTKGSQTIISLNQVDDINNLKSLTSTSSSILDLQDIIYLLDSGILTLKVKPGHRPLHQMLTNLKSNPNDENNNNNNNNNNNSQFNVLKRRNNGNDSILPSRPPPVSAGGKISSEYTLHLLDFMDKYQIIELSKYFKNMVEEIQSNASTVPTEVTPPPSQKSPMKLGSSARLSSRKPPVMNTPYSESDNMSSATQSTIQSNATKGPEYVCFTINRGNGLPDEKWLEIVDSSTKLKYYFNPQTGITQWELPIHTKSR